MKEFFAQFKKVIETNFYFTFPKKDCSDEERIEQIITELEEMGVWK